MTPMTNSNLVEVLQSQSRVEVGLLNHTTMRAGKAACERYLAEQSRAGVRFFIVDVIDPGRPRARRCACRAFRIGYGIG